MTSDDLFTIAQKYENKAQEKKEQKPEPKKEKLASKASPSGKPDSASIGSNVPEMSVSDLAHSLKRTLENTFSHIRVRGELSGIKIAASGHLYGDIKDVDANVNIVCWKGTMVKLPIRPEDGMDVIITGRVSSYAKSSRYQIIIEKMELAGEGALLKLLEDRRKKLAAEGLFDESRKKPLPYLPEVIGVVTSPTGAVIRDIMHRLEERFPRHVLLWPVNVQGAGADKQITQAIDGFNAMNKNSDLPRPDLLIVARGGGSLEDLMAFNEENVVRAVAASDIPIISAVGHETDTTLIDYASDKRAPTPTGAAEIAVPVRADLFGYVQDMQQRMRQSSLRLLQEHQTGLKAHIAGLKHPRQIIENKTQHIDFMAEKMARLIHITMQNLKANVANKAGQLKDPKAQIKQHQSTINHLGQRLDRAIGQTHKDKTQRLAAHYRMLDSLSHKKVLSRGYALVYDENANLVRNIKS